MSQENFEQFRRRVLQDYALQKQLRETDNFDAFVQHVVRLGRENGYTFGVEDVTAAMQANRRAWIERGLG